LLAYQRPPHIGARTTHRLVVGKRSKWAREREYWEGFLFRASCTRKVLFGMPILIWSFVTAVPGFPGAVLFSPCAHEGQILLTARRVKPSYKSRQSYKCQTWQVNREVFQHTATAHIVDAEHNERCLRVAGIFPRSPIPTGTILRYFKSVTGHFPSLQVQQFGSASLGPAQSHRRPSPFAEGSDKSVVILSLKTAAGRSFDPPCTPDRVLLRTVSFRRL